MAKIHTMLTVIGLDSADLPSSRTPHCLEECVQFLAHSPFVSVTVPTRDRPDHSWRSNYGIRAAWNEILAFTDDDDVVVDRYWLAELVRGFSLAKAGKTFAPVETSIPLGAEEEGWEGENITSVD